MDFSKLLLFVALGFAAQMIDGTMGMAYGVSSNTFLRMAGVPSAISSACVHCAEMFTTLVSGLAHIKLRNVKKWLLWRLMIPGAIGGALGAYLLVEFNSAVIDMIIDIYLVVMGVIIISKAFKKNNKLKTRYSNYVIPLGLVGGFSDAMGGGGWGPVVTSTLLASGHDTRKTIGTVNTAEFFVTLAETTTFVAMLGDFLSYGNIILGLIIGGVIAAPFGAYLCKKVPVRPMLGIVGTLVVILNGIKLLQHAGIM